MLQILNSAVLFSVFRKRYIGIHRRLDARDVSFFIDPVETGISDLPQEVTTEITYDKKENASVRVVA